MKIVPKQASAYNRFRCEWNGSEYDTYDVLDDAGYVIGNFETRAEAEKFVDSMKPSSDKWWQD